MDQLTQQHQVHFFCNNSDVPATSEHIARLFTVLRDMDFITTNGNEFNTRTGQQKKFIIMTTPDDKLQVHFRIEEIVFTSQDTSLDSFISNVKKIIEHLKSEYPKKTANRLSVISSEILYSENPEEYNSVYNALFTDREDAFEWDYRNVVRSEISNGEKINCVSAIRRLVVQRESNLFDSLIYDVDCNTLFENQQSRFNFDDTPSILDELISKAKEKITNLKGKGH